MSDNNFVLLEDGWTRSSILDYIMGYEDGAKYIVIYLVLLFMTNDTNGKLVTRVGDLTIPITDESIAKECRYWFDTDTIRDALSLFRKIGFLFEDDGVMTLIDFTFLEEPDDDE